MKPFTVLVLFLAPLMTICNGGDSDEIFHQIDKEQAQMAFKYINHIREFPQEYGEKLGIDLSDIESKNTLAWNDTLAKVAEEKAMDMAKRDYLSQVSPEGIGINILIHDAGYALPDEWIKDRKSNYFGSVQGGAKDGVEAVKNLIIGAEADNSAHLRQLLGTDDFSKNMKDIGIGFVKSYKSTYRTYTCIIIAKHDYK